MEVVRLRAEHYDALLSLLNEVFTIKNGRQMDFLTEMPKMWARDDEHIGRHFGIFDGERLVSCIGVYPFCAVVAGEELRFATMGNIATHPDYEGRGYMSAMIDTALEELKRLDIDIARLGGLRSRYNRYGFEACGQNYSFHLSKKSLTRLVDFSISDITFERILPDSEEYIAFATEVYNKDGIAVPRNIKNAYLSMSMWRSVPYIALRSGNPVGYLSVSERGNSIAEAFATDERSLVEMISAWQAECAENVSLYRMPHHIESTRVFSSVAIGSSIISPSHFKIVNWEKIINAFMKLKASYSKLPVGCLNLEIEDYGRLRIYCDGDSFGCERTESEPDLRLDCLSASRYIFGPHPAVYTADADAFASSLFPLPLAWNPQDRV